MTADRKIFSNKAPVFPFVKNELDFSQKICISIRSVF